MTVLTTLVLLLAVFAVGFMLGDAHGKNAAVRRIDAALANLPE